MARQSLLPLAGLLVLSACQTPAEAPPAPSDSVGSVELDTEDSSGLTGSAYSNDDPPSFCETFDPEALNWFELGAGPPSPQRTDQGVTLTISSTRLPAVSASRYNTLSEICPGFFVTITHEGEARLMAPEDNKWAELPPLEPAGELRNPPAPGIEGGGPVWGFRDSLAVKDTVFLSDGVVDTDDQCVYVAVHRITLEQLLLDGSARTEIVYRSEPCVSYADSYRSQAPIKTHLGGALAYSPLRDELYVSIGDLHLGSSTIGQAESIGVENVEKDYAILNSPTAAVSAVVAISDPFDSAEGRVFSKGLRNSLGMTVTADDEVWLSDHGPSGGDELNRIEEGADYGWPLTSSGQPYDRSSYPDDPNALPAPWLDIYRANIPGTTPPAYSWTPAVAPTSIVEYPSESIEQWRGTLVMSSLRAQSVIVLSNDSGNIVEEDRMPMGERIRDMVVTESGNLVMVTDSSRLVVIAD